MGAVAPIGFRINPDVAAETHAKITTGTADNKFGIAATHALDAYCEAAGLPGLKITGITLHIGSQLMSLGPLEAAFVRLGEILEQVRSAGHEIRLVDLGGGLGVPHGPEQPKPPTPAEYGEMVRRVTGAWNARLIFEPGRLIVANAGVLLTRVIRIKPGARHPWIIVDAAMNDLMRPVLYDAFHSIEAVAPNDAKTTANVVGPVCESGDTFAMAREIDAVSPGDLVIFRTAGAYGSGDVEWLQQPPADTGSAGRRRQLGARAPTCGDRCPRRVRAAGVVGLELLRQLRHDFEQVADEADVGDLEDRRVLVLVDRDDGLGVLHSGEMLDRAGNADRDIEVWRDDLAGLADLIVVGRIAGVDRGARGADRGAELVGERIEQSVELVGRTERAAAGDDDRGAGELGPLALRRFEADEAADPASPAGIDLLDGSTAALRRAAFSNVVPRTVITFFASFDRTVAMALPA